MKILKTIFFVSLTAIMFASCNTDSSNTQKFSMRMLYHASSPSGEAYSIGHTEYELDYSNTSDCGVVINSILMPGAGNSMSLKLEDLTLTSNQVSGFKLVSGPSATSQFQCTIDGPWMNTMFKLNNGADEVIAMNSTPVFFSITNVTGPDGSLYKTSQTDKNIFGIAINEANINSASRSLNFLVEGASFKTDMSESFQLKNIPFKIVGDRLSFSADELPVYIKSSTTADTRHKVLNLSVSGKIGGDYNVSFTWREIDEEGDASDYNVVSTLKTILSTSSNNNN